MKNYLGETRILNYSDERIQSLVNDRNWKRLRVPQQVKEIYNYVRDEIAFGYNSADNISASDVLKDGFGQCNTKGNLLMALLRAVGVPNRIHGFTIDKALQKGAISGVWYYLSPQNILHSWVEVLVDDTWYFLEGVILDKKYLYQLQAMNQNCKTSFCGYGAYVDDLSNPPIDWNFNHTYIQEKGINRDFGLFDTPDAFYDKHTQKLGVLKKLVFQKIVRHRMNNNVRRIRKRTKS